MRRRSPAVRVSPLERQTRALLRRYELRPRKGLGQSFLVSSAVRDLMLRAAALGPDDLVLEIGPGTGTLTEGLVERAGRVIAIERDPGLFRVLAERLGARPSLRLLCADALTVDYMALLGESLTPPHRAKVVSNLPYSVATPLILRLIRLREHISSLLVMVQREVAQRLLARPGQEGYSSLTLCCQYHAEVEAVAQVSAAAFYPRPAVDSTLVRLELLPSPRVTVRSPDLLFRVVRAAFGQRRKTIRNALLGGGIVADSTSLERILARVDIDPKRRGETLALTEFARLADHLHATGMSPPEPLPPPLSPTGGAKQGEGADDDR